MAGNFFPKAVAFLLPLAFSAAARADEPPPAPCAAPVAASGELAPWSSPRPLMAGSDVGHAPPLAIGHAAAVALLQTPQVHYPLRPEKPGGSVSFGGLIEIDVAEAGSYRVALSSSAWIDLVRNGKTAISTAHGRGPDCTGVRKMVDFPLERGHYTLQIGANGTAQMTVLVARLP